MTAKSDDNAAEGVAPAGKDPADPGKGEDADDEGSDGDTNAATGGDATDLSVGDDEDLEGELVEELEAAPLHLHTLRVPARLRGSSTPVGVRSRSSSRSRSRSSSRDVSPSPHASGKKGHQRRDSKGSDAVPSLVLGESSAGTGGAGSSAASVASVEEIDPDILLDRAGIEELEPPPPHEIAMGPLAASPILHASGLLTSVNERMSEESLDDCHAFTDVVSALHSSLKSLKDDQDAEAEGCVLLETLEEEDDDEEGSSDKDNADEGKALTKKNLKQLQMLEQEAATAPATKADA